MFDGQKRASLLPSVSLIWSPINSDQASRSSRLSAFKLGLSSFISNSHFCSFFAHLCQPWYLLFRLILLGVWIDFGQNESMNSCSLQLNNLSLLGWRRQRLLDRFLWLLPRLLLSARVFSSRRHRLVWGHEGLVNDLWGFKVYVVTLLLLLYLD